VKEERDPLVFKGLDFGCLCAHVFALGLGLFFLVRELLVLVLFKCFLIKIFFLFFT
jgi:hypothetical protein